MYFDNDVTDLPAEVPAAVLRSIPKAWQACFSGWVIENNTNDPFKLYSPEEYSEFTIGRSVCNTFLHNANSMHNHLSLAGFPNTPIHRYLMLLPNKVMESLVEYANSQLAAKGKEITNIVELRNMIIIFWYRTRYRVSSQYLWSTDLAHALSLRGFCLAHARSVYGRHQICPRGSRQGSPEPGGKTSGLKP